MKLTLAALLCAAFIIAANAFGQIGMQTGGGLPPVTANSVQEYTGGEHVPLIFTQTLRADVAGTWYSSRWFQYGYSTYATQSQNKAVQAVGADIFSAVIGADAFNVGDSVAMPYEARFQIAYDTTKVIIPPDSLNKFILSGSYGTPFYSIWQWEPLTACQATGGTYDTTLFTYALKIPHGAFARLCLYKHAAGAGAIADTVNWPIKFIAEH